jgi:hypothetical protein
VFTRRSSVCSWELTTKKPVILQFTLPSSRRSPCIGTPYLCFSRCVCAIIEASSVDSRGHSRVPYLPSVSIRRRPSVVRDHSDERCMLEGLVEVSMDSSKIKTLFKDCSHSSSKRDKLSNPNTRTTQPLAFWPATALALLRAGRITTS